MATNDVDTDWMERVRAHAGPLERTFDIEVGTTVATWGFVPRFDRNKAAPHGEDMFIHVGWNGWCKSIAVGGAVIDPLKVDLVSEEGLAKARAAAERITGNVQVLDPRTTAHPAARDGGVLSHCSACGRLFSADDFRGHREACPVRSGGLVFKNATKEAP